AARPSASAISTAASTIRSWLSSRLGPRCGMAATPHAIATSREIPSWAMLGSLPRSSCSPSIAHPLHRTHTVCIAHSVCRIQKGVAMNGTLELEGLSKSYGDPVIDDLDLRIDGGIFALLGPNGAGKTTLVSILTTLVTPDA